MTNPTPHGQVPEALRLAEQYDHGDPAAHGNAWKAAVCTELRRQHARIAELEAQIAAVGAGGVQALSAAPVAFLKSVIALCSHRGYSPANIEVWDKDDKWIADLWRQAESMLTSSPTPPAEQPIGEVVVTKDEDGQIVAVTRQDDEGHILSVIATCDPAEQQAEESRVKLLAECRDAFPIPEPSSPLEVQWAAAMARPEEVPEYVRLCVAAMQAAPKAAPARRTGTIAHIGNGRTTLVGALASVLAAPQQEAQEPMFWVRLCGDGLYEGPIHNSRIEEVRKQSGVWSPLYTAPQPAPAPLSDEVLKEVIKDSNRYRWLRRPLLNAGQGSIQVVMDDRLNGKLDRVIFLDALDKAIDAALAAQGGKA